MNKEEIKELARQEFMNNVMSNLDSTLIFTYIQNLEQQNKQLLIGKDNVIKYKNIVEALKKKIKDDFANQLEPTGIEMLNLIEELEKGEENE